MGAAPRLERRPAGAGAGRASPVQSIQSPVTTGSALPAFRSAGISRRLARLATGQRNGGPDGRDERQGLPQGAGALAGRTQCHASLAATHRPASGGAVRRARYRWQGRSNQSRRGPAQSARQCRVVALSKPSDQEKTQWYFQRYVAHLPSAGEVVLFDRSWYNRAGVERVMGYCSDDQAKAFLKAVPEFEDLLIKDGILLFKYWLTTRSGLPRRTAGRAAGRSIEALETLADRSGRA
jgi:hypothetical protein